MAFSPEDIERLNAHGPYDHAQWRSGDVVVTSEQRITGRGAYLVRTIRSVLEREFTRQEMARLSLVDVGCYDGWVLHQLEDLPFARLVGIEPREKNRRKGEVAREVLRLRTRVEFRVGTIEDLGEHFDVVLCLGVLHHVESIPAALRELRSICRRFLFLETMCLSSQHVTGGLRREIEPKDVAYFGRPRVVGLTGQKLESPYYDGSTTKFGVVNIPSVDAVRMHLQVANFDAIRVEVDPDTYRAAIWGAKRTGTAVCISSRPAMQDAQVGGMEVARSYERGLARTRLEDRDIEALIQVVRGAHTPFALTPLAFLALAYASLPSAFARFALRLAAMLLRDRYAIEIFTNLRFNLNDKVLLEWGKVLHARGEYGRAIAELRTITRKLNADSRASYRAFYLLSRCFEKLNDPEEAGRYRDLCLTCNPLYPLDALP